MSRPREKESRRALVLTTIVFFVVLAILVVDFLDNGKIDNGKFLIVALFVFSGAGAGRAIDALVDKYLGPPKGDDHG